MTTPLKKALRLAHAALAIGLLAHSNIVSAQSQPIAFGDTKQQQFTASSQTHQYTVTTTAGDRLLIHVKSPGTTLRTWVRIFDPAGTPVERWGPSRSHERESQALSAGGPHRIEVKNSREIGSTPSPSAGSIAMENKSSRVRGVRRLEG